MKEEISNEDLYNYIQYATDLMRERSLIGIISIAYMLGEPEPKAQLTTSYNRDAISFVIRSIADRDDIRSELIKIKDIIEEALDL